MQLGVAELDRDGISGRKNVTWWFQFVLHAAQRPSREMLTDSYYASIEVEGLAEL